MPYIETSAKTDSASVENAFKLLIADIRKSSNQKQQQQQQRDVFTQQRGNSETRRSGRGTGQCAFDCLQPLLCSSLCVFFFNL